MEYFLSSGWGIIWKVLLSRLGLFRELFNGKNSADVDSRNRTKKGRTEARHLKSSLVQRHKEGSSRPDKKVWFDHVTPEPSDSLETEQSSELT